ncbi:MAG: galactonate dehydratase [SAR202 cluster bacterium]|jgi:galactonate dehydratase|nr:galactonate dehydratase [SAR202 cluster bacterium]
MKITDVKVFVTGADISNFIFVKLYTDAGITGVGECSVERFGDVGVKAVESFKDFLIGKDPAQVEYIWNSLYKQQFWYGQFAILCALSGVEHALWDIKGQALGVPVYDMMGGKLRDSVRAYANGWSFRPGPGGSGPDESPDNVARNAQDMVDIGFTAMKWDPFRTGGQVIPKHEEVYAVESVRAAREAVGPDIDLLIECHGRFNMWSAIRMANKLEEFDPSFYEEPIPPDNIDAMAEVQRSINIPVATGERLFTRWDYRQLLEKQAARIIQPDICHAGGIFELKKIAAMAESYYVSVQPHNSNGPISTVASLHLDACIPNVIFQELIYPRMERYNELLTEPIELEGGYLRIPDRPGLGTDVKEDVIKKYPPIENANVASANWMGSYW